MLGINISHAKPIYEQLVSGIESMVLSGVLEPGEPLPSVRELAAQLAVNPNTIQKAYSQLEARRVTCSIPGKGSFVTDNIGALKQSRIHELLQRIYGTSRELKQHGANKEQVLTTVEQAFMKEGEHD